MTKKEQVSSKILIIGAGIAGLGLAQFLKRLDIDFDIMERATDFTHMGYEIAVWDNGRDILKKLHLDEAFDAAGRRVFADKVLCANGEELADFSFSHLQALYGGSVTIVTREDLHTLLRNGVQEKVQLGVAVEKVTETEHGVDVLFKNGTTRTYDLVVGADGVHSVVRANLNLGKEYPEGWKAYYVWVPRELVPTDSIYTVLTKAGSISAFRTKERGVLTFFAHDPSCARDQEEGRIDRLTKLFEDATCFVPECFKGLKDADVLVSDLFDVSLSVWHGKRTVVIGDAAHFCGPYAGMGASFALEDAYVLAAELYRYMHGSKDYAAAFQALQEHQKVRLSHVLWVTKK